MLALALAVASRPFAAETGAVILDAQRPGVWQSDGMWKITPRKDCVEFLKDEQPMHNSMCWMTLPSQLAKGQTVEITYLMQAPYKHVDLFLGNNCGRPDPKSPMPEFAEIVSLGGTEVTSWQTRRLTVTSTQTINTLGFLCWGWPVDRGTWMRVASLRVQPAGEPREWIVWRVPPPLNDKRIPARCPLQDFFPFGVYFPMEFGENYKHEGLRDRWEWYDRALADIKARGMNFTSVTNLGAADLDQLAALHTKHGLRMNPQVGEFNVKLQGQTALKPFLRAAEKYRDNPVIAGWAVGEEFTPEEVPLLDLPHEIVRAVDPKNTLVTIHNNAEAFRKAGQLLDIRIAFRDIYPFFAEPSCGPVGHEESMNYYEDEIDKAQRLLPQGASLWVMPQAQHEYYSLHEGNPPQFVFRQPTPAEIALETWAALAHGAQGIAYFLYPSSAPARPGGIPPLLALRTYDGKPTPQLEALTALAKKLVPLGPIITHWERVRLPAATDHRELRAYLFSRPAAEAAARSAPKASATSRPYLLVFNHDPKQSVTGRVRVPFSSPKVSNLLARTNLKVTTEGQATSFSLTLPPGEGTILQLSGVAPTNVVRLPKPDEPDEAVDTPQVSGRPRPDLPLTDLPDGRKLFRYQVDLQKTEGVPPGDSLSEDVAFQDWRNPGANYMNGVYGRELAFLFEMPSTIATLSVSGRYANHADGKPYTYRILYSLDGKDFKPAAEKANLLAGNGEEVTGTVSLPARTRRVWVTYTFPIRSIGVVLKAMDVQVTLSR